MAYRLSVDIGGTFTDLAVVDEQGKVGLFKSASTPTNPAQGVKDVLGLACKAYGTSQSELLSDTELLVHGTTVSTNAVRERRAAKTGLLCTKGFDNILYYRQAGKKDPFNLWMEYVEPYVPHYLTFPVEERIGADGQILIPLNEQDVQTAIRQLKKWNVEAIAVCFLWAHVNPIHEKRVGEIIEEEWPGIPYSLSHKVQPVIREFVRTSSTCLDASLRPVVTKYCDDLDTWLRENGFRHEFLMVVASGGVVGIREAIVRPVYTIFSGPTMGAVAGLLFSAERGFNNVVTIDMGGTSFDVSANLDGIPLVTDSAMVAELPIGVTSVEINSIGASGGSIAWVDTAGVLRVGPRSAGAVPGPACYMLGGEEPTVTDANVVLGYVNPDFFLGGTMKLTPELSWKAIEEKVARPLKIGVEEAANGIISLVNTNITNAILTITRKRGINLRDFLLFVGGGAGPTHAAYLARELDMKHILIPKMAGGLCALGMLNADLKFHNVGSFYTESTRFDPEAVNRLLEDLEARAIRALQEQGIPPERRKIEYYFSARYPGQVYELQIPLRSSRVSQDSLPQMVDDFHSEHERRYFTSERTNYIEMLCWRVTATGVMPRITFPEQPLGSEDTSPALKGKRKAYLYGGFIDTPIYDGGKLVHGMIIQGPAIIEDYGSSPLIPRGVKCTITKLGDYYLELE